MAGCGEGGGGSQLSQRLKVTWEQASEERCGRAL